MQPAPYADELPANVLDRVVTLYGWGWTLDAIAERTGLGTSSVAGIIIGDLRWRPVHRLSVFEQNLLHLIDLKRAGHSARFTELCDPPEWEFAEGVAWRIRYPRPQRVQSGPTVSG